MQAEIADHPSKIEARHVRRGQQEQNDVVIQYVGLGCSEANCGRASFASTFLHSSGNNVRCVLIQADLFNEMPIYWPRSSIDPSSPRPHISQDPKLQFIVQIAMALKAALTSPMLPFLDRHLSLCLAAEP